MNRIALHIPADHPAFEGHFPSRPIVPGVVLLALTQQALEAQLGQPMTGLASAKFLRPLAPGEAVLLAHTVTDTGVGFSLHLAADDTLVASGRFLRAPA
ncbi:3-hydroxyacyl-ACP dehydratase [Ideonella oryzae]|uniref:3-hydroxyacyl-ACP dehydratase n=1 Tax=Ideonella oryzae TaxID=2937441 RepID=A0ABT1BKU5_9BURK|nr:3-hydroxyacyl-ACP dehydratase [Ideonella oryzae]MCO5976032.1 3-hydroxyacyl-ACP dehydratase [Ideonella oryzae]